MIEIFTIKPRIRYGSNCYVIKNNDSWAVIDPSVRLNEIKSEIPTLKSLPGYVLITHAHFDHILEIDDYKSKDIRICVGRADANNLNDPYYNCYQIFLDQKGGYDGEYTALSDGDVIDLDGARIRVIETPGHTIGSVCYLMDDIAFVGDLIFKNNGYGRFDLPGGNREELFNSIDKFYKAFRSGTVYSGHGSSFLI